MQGDLCLRLRKNGRGFVLNVDVRGPGRSGPVVARTGEGVFIGRHG
jgi:hypothetical protein